MDDYRKQLRFSDITKSGMNIQLYKSGMNSTSTHNIKVIQMIITKSKGADKFAISQAGIIPAGTLRVEYRLAKAESKH